MIVAIAFVVFLAIGTPVAFVLGLTALTHIATVGNQAFLTIMPQRMFTAVDKFELMAIPFFMLAGELMSYGGIARRLINFTRTLVGQFRGGMAYVNILVGMFMAAIMGSATAEAAARAPILVPAMEEEGYDTDFSAAVTAAGSLLGPIIPPSMVFIVYGVSAGVSVGALFLGGVFPGLLLTALLCAVVYAVARRRNYPISEKNPSLAKFFRAFGEAGPSLLLPPIIVGGILSGLFTPTESAVIASVYAFILGFFFYRELKREHLFKVFLNTGVTSAAIVLIMGTANIFGWSLAIQQVPQKIAMGLTAISSNPVVVMILINLLLLFIGCIMEGLAAMIVLVPVFLPLMAKLGLDPVHFGVVISVNLIIGLITPPVGLVLYIISGMTKVPMGRLSRALVPFIAVSVVALAIIAFYPPIVTWLPDFVMKGASR